MIDWLLIAGFVLFGIALVIVEIIFIPGTTIVGIIGFIMMIFGVYHAYDTFGNETGHIVLAGSAVLGAGLTIYSFKAGHWERFALKKTIDSKVNEGKIDPLSVGQKGKSLSVCKPVGKAEFDGKEYEVSTLGDYLEQDTEIEIIQIDNQKIYVKPLKS